jgi:hypothetical protein
MNHTAERTQSTHCYLSRFPKSNKIVVPRERAEAAIVKYLAIDLLSPEAIEIAKREYQSAILERAERKHQDNAELDALRAEEVLLRKMLRDRTLSPDVA